MPTPRNPTRNARFAFLTKRAPKAPATSIVTQAPLSSSATPNTITRIRAGTNPSWGNMSSILLIASPPQGMKVAVRSIIVCSVSAVWNAAAVE